MTEKLSFPNGFLWGTATSAYQVEGAIDADGRGESIWDRFCRQPDAVERGETGERACEHYHRLDEDIGLMADLAVNAYRFSIAWPRVLPEGTGKVERRGLGHYDRMIDELLARGITPLPTLYHWDLPQPLQDEGGWRNRRTAEHFADYAALCFDTYGDRVSNWITVNEPWIAGLLGHQLGLHAPGERDLAGSAAAMHHLLLAHGLASVAHQESGWGGSCGVAFSLFPHEPDTDSQADREAAHGSDGYVNRWFLDPVLTGRYPPNMRRHWEQAIGALDFIKDGDEARIGSGAGLIGVNFYTRRIVRAAEPGGDGPFPWRVRPGRESVPRTDLGWEVVPDTLAELLIRLHRDYPGVPIMITENGAVYNDEPGAGAAVRDERRVRFLHAHLAAVHRAITAGAPIHGYFHWSLMDNFEWAMGYRPCFGLVHVDGETGARTVKRSGEWYARAAKDNGIPPYLGGDLP